MKSFEKLCIVYDEGLHHARELLPPVSEYPFPFVHVHVMVETPFLGLIPAKSNSTSDLSRHIVTYHFRKEVLAGVVIGWEHYKPTT